MPFQWIILGAWRSKIEHFKLQGTLVAFKARLHSHLKKTGDGFSVASPKEALLRIWAKSVELAPVVALAGSRAP